MRGDGEVVRTKRLLQPTRDDDGFTWKAQLTSRRRRFAAPGSEVAVLWAQWMFCWQEDR